MINRVLVIVLFSCFFEAVSAQKLDSIQSIKSVEITADKISIFAAGLKVQKVDSAVLSIRQGVNLATLLTEQSAVTLRSYGPGGIASLSMRGTNSSHSGVFWNGINLNQPNIGQADLSRISTFEFSDISLQSGGASTLLGSGVLGGSLHLSNNMKYSTPALASMWLSSATSGKLNGAVKFTAGSKTVAYSGSITGDWNENDFWYNSLENERKKLEHALVKTASSIHQVEMKLNAKQRISAGIWYQKTDRQIPPTMTMAESDQTQKDQALRCSVQYFYTGDKQLLSVKSAFVDEKELFQSDLALIDASYHINTFQSELEYKRFINKQITLGSGITGRLLRADVPYYEKITFQHEGSVWMGVAFSHAASGIKSALNLRQDFTKGFQIPFCPSFGINVPLSGSVTASFSVSRNFRVPTLNDRYWIPGGNPDLKPENSWNFEAGSTFKLKESKYYTSSIAINFYNLTIDNLIQWIPANSTIWSPVNIQKVWSRGAELTSKTDWKIIGFSGYFKLSYNYSPSSYRSKTSGDIQNYNKQLIYMPKHKIVEVFYVKKGTWYGMFSYSLTGKRYVLNDNSKSLPSYTKMDMYLGSSVKIKKINIRLQAEIHNLLNNQFQSVMYYPEPGRTFSISILLSK